MLRRFLAWVVAFLAPPRVIRQLLDSDPYLTRWYLTTRPTMPDGSEPFDELGHPREGIQWSQRKFGIYLHRFDSSDRDRDLHNHPWKWAIAFVLVGGYVEERRVETPVHCEVVRRVVKPFRFNLIRHGDFHRVDLNEQDAWTLFIAGPKASSWGFLDLASNSVVPWRQYVNRVRTAAGLPRLEFDE